MKLAVLLSGRGSNFAAIHDAILEGRLNATIEVVISNRPEAAGLQRAREAGLRAEAVDHRLSPGGRAAHDEAVLDLLRGSGAELVVLAGYMRLLSPFFIDAYRNRIVNIHPSLLPSFPGLHAQAQAIAYGAKITGCTVHFVDEGLDSGPIILQRCLEIEEGDTEESLSARLLPIEHATYVEALQKLVRGVRIEGRRVVASSPV